MIDTVHLSSIDIVHHDTVHCNTVHRDTIHRDTVHPDTVHSDNVHLVKNDTTCGETERIEMHILKVDENGLLRDEEGRTRNSAEQLINAQGAVIPDVIVVAEMNDFDLNQVWYDWVGQDPFQNYNFSIDQHYDFSIDQHRCELLLLLLTSINTTISALINTATSESIETRTSTSIDTSTSAAIDTAINSYFCHRSIPLVIPERSSCPQDLGHSTQKSTNVSSCYPTPNVEKVITMEDFLELEEFLELKDGEQPGDLDSSREVTMEDYLELEEWLEDMDQSSTKKLDDNQHTSRGDMETSPKSYHQSTPT